MSMITVLIGNIHAEKSVIRNTLVGKRRRVMDKDFLNTEEYYKDACIKFNVEPGKCIIFINKDGIKFNHKDYPNATADAFAQAFVDILEKQYVVTMEKRKKESDGNTI